MKWSAVSSGSEVDGQNDWPCLLFVLPTSIDTQPI